MKYRLLILLFLLSSALTTTAQKKYDAVFKKIDKSYTLHDDGSIDYTYRKELQLNSQRSFDKMYGETFIVYNPEYQELKINEAYTIRKDGSRVNTPANAFNEVLPSNCTDCGRYSGVKEMVVTHTALEYGATIVLDYLQRFDFLESATVMVQKEVADRLTAQPDTPDYAAITLAVQMIGSAKITRNVSRNMFYPAPNVDSAVVRIDIDRTKLAGEDVVLLRKLARSAFMMRRKTLANNLSQAFGITKAEATEKIVFDLVHTKSNRDFIQRFLKTRI